MKLNITHENTLNKEVSFENDWCECKIAANDWLMYDRSGKHVTDLKWQ